LKCACSRENFEKKKGEKPAVAWIFVEESTGNNTTTCTAITDLAASG
jgi:hypothetical protein